MRVPVLTISAALLLSLAVRAQQVPAPLTLHARAKEVVVDVVVTDRDHHPIHDLKQQDFAIFEGHAPQAVVAFEEHKALSFDEAAKIATPPPLPPGTFSNFNPAPTNTAINILLLDTMNTAWQDQTFVRTQVMNYLKQARPGANVAIFGLATHLVMLQGFTTNPEVLRSAMLKQSGGYSHLLDDPVHGGLPMTGEQLSAEMGGQVDAAMLQTFLDTKQSADVAARARYTLDAMNILAHYLSAIPGRKNLIWFSGAFPLSLMPDITYANKNPFAGMGSFEAEYRETARLLANSQIAVYPVDARGLMIGSAGEFGGGRNSNPGLKDFILAEPFETMQQMAEDTGGRAFINSNGLAQAVDQAIDDGSNYYTITYRPSDQTASGRFRKTEVKLAQKGYLLEYRHGYYEDGAPQTRQGIANANPPDLRRSLMFRAMQHGAPASSEILFKARVLPAPDADEGAHRSLTPSYLRHYAVDFAVLPTDIAYTLTTDGLRHFNLEFATFAYRSDGAMANRTVNVVKGTLTPAQFAAMSKTGFPYRQEINVPLKGDYSLRLGIHDVTAYRVGTTELPVASVRDLPPAVAAGAAPNP